MDAVAVDNRRKRGNLLPEIDKRGIAEKAEKTLSSQIDRAGVVFKSIDISLVVSQSTRDSRA